MANDGFDYQRDDDDDGAPRLIKGTKLKYTNEGTWEDNDDNVIEADHEFVAVELLRAVQKWIDQHPTVTRIMAPDEPFPDVNELNDAAPSEEWTEKFGKRVGPWQRCWAVYLLDPKTMRIYTWPTDTVGGHQAVRDLREQTGMARSMHGDSVYPRVRLGSTHMKTQYGGRQRPEFDILGFEKLGGGGGQKLSAPAPAPKPLPPASDQKLIEAKANGKSNGKANGGEAANPTETKPVASKQQVATKTKKSKSGDPDFDATK